MGKLVASAFILTLFGCASVAAPPSAASPPSEVLVTTSYRLEVSSHCPEGEVGCSHLTGTLLSKAGGKPIQLIGTVRMVLCRDGVTPCHIGFYELADGRTKVQAYPEGTLAVALEGKQLVIERGSWYPR